MQLRLLHYGRHVGRTSTKPFCISPEHKKKIICHILARYILHLFTSEGFRQPNVIAFVHRPVYLLGRSPLILTRSKEQRRLLSTWYRGALKTCVQTMRLLMRSIGMLITNRLLCWGSNPNSKSEFEFKFKKLGSSFTWIFCAYTSYRRKLVEGANKEQQWWRSKSAGVILMSS